MLVFASKHLIHLISSSLFHVPKEKGNISSCSVFSFDFVAVGADCQHVTGSLYPQTQNPEWG